MNIKKNVAFQRLFYYKTQKINAAKNLLPILEGQSIYLSYRYRHKVLSDGSFVLVANNQQDIFNNYHNCDIYQHMEKV